MKIFSDKRPEILEMINPEILMKLKKKFPFDMQELMYKKSMLIFFQLLVGPRLARKRINSLLVGSLFCG